MIKTIIKKYQTVITQSVKRKHFRASFENKKEEENNYLYNEFKE
jgi:hypothetical protein